MLWRTIAADLFRYTGRTRAVDFVKALRNSAFRFSVVFRTCNCLANSGNLFARLALIPSRAALAHYSRKHGYDIPAAANIGGGLHLGDRGPITLNPDAVLGSHVSVAPGVVIAQANLGERKGCPTIGNSVRIGADTVLVGRITVGNNVVIGPGCFVNFDVPDDAVVAGNPAVICLPAAESVPGRVTYFARAPQ